MQNLLCAITKAWRRRPWSRAAHAAIACRDWITLKRLNDTKGRGNITNAARRSDIHPPFIKAADPLRRRRRVRGRLHRDHLPRPCDGERYRRRLPGCRWPLMNVSSGCASSPPHCCCCCRCLLHLAMRMTSYTPPNEFIWMGARVRQTRWINDDNR